MKKFFLFPAALVLPAALLLLAPAVQAQTSSSVCGSIVDEDCVGACNGTVGHLSYVVPSVSVAADNKVCLKVTEYSLCGSHRAAAIVYVNGVPRGPIGLHPGFAKSMTVNPGDVIKVKFGIKQVNDNVFCVWLGNVRLALFD